jgi:hypothetical protein
LIPAMKLVTERPFANPEVAARQLAQLASGIEPVQDGRIHIEKINYPFLYTLKGSGAEFGAGIRCAVEKGWLKLHESGRDLRAVADSCRNLVSPPQSAELRSGRARLSRGGSKDDWWQSTTIT